MEREGTHEVMWLGKGREGKVAREREREREGERERELKKCS